VSTRSTSARPGAVTVEGLTPATDVEVRLDGQRVARFSTLAPAPGRELFRFATVNDLHMGEDRFGVLRTIREPDAEEPSANRCARAALDEALAWGAQAIVVKGDLVAKGEAEEWDAAGALLASLPVPYRVLYGNHEVNHPEVDGSDLLTAHGVEVTHHPDAFDVAGLRIVLLPTAVRDSGHGAVHAEDRERTAELVRDAPGAAFVAMHHYPQRFRIPNAWPPGIPGDQAKALLDAVASANRATLVASGHSHRHRRHHHGPIVIAEIGSTKDFPGTWAGYVVHEGGIRQVVYRVARPDAIAWTEQTRRAVFGLWGKWSPGLRSHRCFTHVWPER
jgi:3',5'-cyclic-AMP phosphodiesterase